MPARGATTARRLLLPVLKLVKTGVVTVLCHQLAVCARFNEPPLVKDEDAVDNTDRVEPMSND